MLPWQTQQWTSLHPASPVWIVCSQQWKKDSFCLVAILPHLKKTTYGGSLMLTIFFDVGWKLDLLCQHLFLVHFLMGTYPLKTTNS